VVRVVWGWSGVWLEWCVVGVVCGLRVERHWRYLKSAHYVIMVAAIE